MRAPLVSTCYNDYMTESKYNRYKHTTFQSEILNKIIINSEKGCHEFSGPLNENGYGRISFKGKKIYVHRAVYEHFNGPIPNGLIIRHKCDNPKCCNVEHLELGNQYDNCMDKVKRNRQAKGNKIPQSKLNEEKVLKMRKLHAEGITQKKLAEMYGVDSSQISRVVNRIDWKWL